MMSGSRCRNFALYKQLVLHENGDAAGSCQPLANPLPIPMGMCLGRLGKCSAKHICLHSGGWVGHRWEVADKSRA